MADHPVTQIGQEDHCHHPLPLTDTAMNITQNTITDLPQAVELTVATASLFLQELLLKTVDLVVQTPPPPPLLLLVILVKRVL